MKLLILLGILSFSAISTAEETVKKKRSIFGEHYPTPFLHQFSLGNLVDLGQHADPFFAQEEHNIVETYSLPHLEQNVALPISHSFHNTHYSVPRNFYPKKKFIPYSFERPDFYQNFPEAIVYVPAPNLEPKPKSLDSTKDTLQIQTPQTFQTPQNQVQTRKPVIALGSGSLGITRLSNGRLILGSGSLGYTGSTNDSGRNNNNQEIKEVQSNEIAEKQNNLGLLPSLPEPNFFNQFQPTLW